mmetsp:Transcript_111162/g.313690  ORF Transcript_111162/g.313690 Transcript_111162/m.313690 type:complete len:250 (+) Transcript_111162:355-1104(+)
MVWKWCHIFSILLKLDFCTSRRQDTCCGRCAVWVSRLSGLTTKSTNRSARSSSESTRFAKAHINPYTAVSGKGNFACGMSSNTSSKQKVSKASMICGSTISILSVRPKSSHDLQHFAARRTSAPRKDLKILRTAIATSSASPSLSCHRQPNDASDPPDGSEMTSGVTSSASSASPPLMASLATAGSPDDVDRAMRATLPATMQDLPSTVPLRWPNNSLLQPRLPALPDSSSMPGERGASAAHNATPLPP